MIAQNTRNQSIPNDWERTKAQAARIGINDAVNVLGRAAKNHDFSELMWSN